MKGVIYEHQAAAAADTAKALWPRQEDVMTTIEWALVRDPGIGVPLFHGSPIKVAVFNGAPSIGMPTVEITYQETANAIILHDLEFRK